MAGIDDVAIAAICFGRNDRRLDDTDGPIVASISTSACGDDFV